MNFKRRLTIYLLGVLIGCIAAWMFFGERLTNTAWMPKDRIRKRLMTTLIQASPQAESQLIELGSDLEQIRRQVPDADVILKETRRSGDSLFYVLITEARPRALRLVVLASRDIDRDTVATLWSVGER